MKFSVLQFFSWPNRRGELRDVYSNALERIKIMDQNGFDAVWLAEHHFSTYSVCPSVHIMGMHVADITTNLRIGTAVSLAAFYHPLRLAEEVALLDQLSGGRVNWGAGRGFDMKEMEVFDVDPSTSQRRFREHIDIVLNAWQNGSFSYSGEWNDYTDVEVLPKPLQQPIPFWFASTSIDAVRWSGEQGYSILMDPHASHVEIAEKYSLYCKTLEERGHDGKRETPMARLLAVAPTDEAAEQIAYNGSQWMFGSYFNQNRGGSGAAGQSNQRKLDDYVNGSVIHGCPERVADTLLELQETIPLDYLMAAPLSRRTFTSFVDDVMPRLA